MAKHIRMQENKDCCSGEFPKILWSDLVSPPNSDICASKPRQSPASKPANSSNG